MRRGRTRAANGIVASLSRRAGVWPAVPRHVAAYLTPLRAIVSDTRGPTRRLMALVATALDQDRGTGAGRFNRATVRHDGDIFVGLCEHDLDLHCRGGCATACIETPRPT